VDGATEEDAGAAVALRDVAVMERMDGMEKRLERAFGLDVAAADAPAATDDAACADAALSAVDDARIFAADCCCCCFCAAADFFSFLPRPSKLERNPPLLELEDDEEEEDDAEEDDAEEEDEVEDEEDGAVDEEAVVEAAVPTVDTCVCV